MYKNLLKEMEKRDVTRKDLAKFLNKRYATILDKLNGKYAFSCDEGIAIQRNFFADIDFIYLFERDDAAKKTA